MLPCSQDLTRKKSLIVPSADGSFTSLFTKKIPLFVDEQKSVRKGLQATN